MIKRMIAYILLCFVFIAIGIISLNSKELESYPLLLDVAQEEEYVDVEQTLVIPLNSQIQLPEYDSSERYVDGKTYTGMLKLVSSQKNLENKTVTGTYKGRLELITIDPYEE